MTVIHARARTIIAAATSNAIVLTVRPILLLLRSRNEFACSSNSARLKSPEGSHGSPAPSTDPARIGVIDSLHHMLRFALCRYILCLSDSRFPIERISI